MELQKVTVGQEDQNVAVKSKRFKMTRPIDGGTETYEFDAHNREEAVRITLDRLDVTIIEVEEGGE